MEDIRLKELRCIIESFNESGNLTDVALKNIIQFLGYTEIRFNKVVSDHKAVVETLRQELKQNQIEYGEMQKNLHFTENENKMLQNKIDELEKENKSLKGANETMNIIINNMEDLGV